MATNQERDKMIFVVEDTTEDFTSLRGILSTNNYSVYPPMKKHEEFIKCIRTYYDASIEEDTVVEAKEKISDLLGEQSIDGFIIDYELEQGKGNCSGISFYRNFIKKNNELRTKPVLFLTKMKGNNFNGILTFVDEINRGCRTPIAGLMSKDDFQDIGFRRDLESKFKDLFEEEELRVE